MVTAVGVRIEERWGAGEKASSRKEYRGRDHRSDVHDRFYLRDDFRGGERFICSTEDSLHDVDYRGGERRNNGDEKLREERYTGEREARYRGDEGRRCDDRKLGRSRDEPQRSRREKEELPERKDAEFLEEPSLPPVPSGRSGGVYISPFILAQMLKDVDDKSSVQY